MNKKIKGITAIALLLSSALLFGCSDYTNIEQDGSAGANSAAESVKTTAESNNTESIITEENSTSETEAEVDSGLVSLSYAGDTVMASTNTIDIFTERDLTLTPDLSAVQTVTLSDNSNVSVTEEGIYYLTGTAENFTVTVEADENDKIQIVLENADIKNENFPVIYVKSADKCFITPLSENTLSVSGEFTADSDTNTDAVIYSREDLVLNGTGTLTIDSPYGNGISAKDDFKATGGTYNISCASDGIEVNDSISICGGEFNITSQKDAVHCENSDDNTLGSVFIENGTFNLNAASDGIQATTTLQIEGGNFNICAAEGLESTYIQINDGNIYIEAYDDGINATYKSTAFDVMIEFNGGNTVIVMGAGDTDSIDANGSIIVNGGTIDITGNSSFDCDGNAQYNGGTIIVNGTQVDSIPQSMMGGKRGGRNW